MKEIRRRAVLVRGHADAIGDALQDRLRRQGPEIDWRAVSGSPERARLPAPRVYSLLYAAASRGRWGLPDPADAAAWLERCRADGVEHVVMLSSAGFFVPSERHPGLVDETYRSPARRRHAIAGAWQDLESLARERLDGGSVLTILRPTLMPVRGGRNPFSELFEGRLALTLPGHDPILQVIAPEDVAAGVRLAVLRRAAGIFHLAPATAISLRHALRLCGVTRVPVPRLLQAAVRGLLARLGWAAPPAWLDAIRYDRTVSGRAAAVELGFTPSYGSSEALRRLRQPGGGSASVPGGTSDTAIEHGDDPYGMDRDTIAAWSRTLFRFLHDVYWRIELAGLEHVPRRGPVVLVGTHRGFFPWDGIMMLHAMVRDAGRYPRFMVHPGLLKFPFLFDFFRKLGGVLACRDNADRILEQGGMLGVFPEGVRGAFKMYSEAYRLESFGSAEFVRAAWRHGATIVPFVTVGSAEAMPIVGKIESRRWRRYALWPYIPLTPTLVPIPLPAKWHTRFLAPIDPESVPSGRDTRGAAARMSDEIRARMQQAVDEILERRRSVLRGRVFD